MALNATRAAVVALVVEALCASSGEADVDTEYALDSMPPEYGLQAYDDCGVEGRQPHVVCAGVHDYSPASVAADERARTVAWDWTEVKAVYDGLSADPDYAVAVTYANEPFNHRVQSLWAGSVELHGPRELPKGGAERLLFRLPREAYPDGHLELAFRMEAQVNAVVSVVELWAAAPSPATVHLSPVWALYGDVHGEVLDLRYDPLPDAQVDLVVDGEVVASTQTDEGGAYRLDRSVLDQTAAMAQVELLAMHGGTQDRRTVPPEERRFEPTRYRPIPSRQGGLKNSQIPLDGEWRVHPEPIEDGRGTPLDANGWKPFRVPGQWLQQGYDIPHDQPVAVAREFRVPARWAGRRIILRFDAIHAGTDYWLNGRHIGRSENLFTPVEWDVTDAVRPGVTNRLDLEMTVDTLSEKLAHASGYAFHNLGGIDRSVRLFALPPVHVRHLRVGADFEDESRDGRLRLELAIDNATGERREGMELAVSLRDPEGRLVGHTTPRLDLATLGAAGREVTLESIVSRVLPWSAEKPDLYHLTVELRQGERLVERIQRNIGFRRIEVRGSQLYVNGRRVKLAGACRHEIDPLTGRADTARHAETDVELLKAANLNYIRTSHYPPTRELLEAADRHGMYVEVEAPFCWVGSDRDPSHLRAVLAPTSAMIDYHHSHPSVILWSLANESQLNPLFEASGRLCKELDPTRPKTFNNPDPERVCDIANLHYAPMPYDQHLPDDPRPILLGEYFFPVCHEQADVMVNPGLRELWGAGHSDPDSAWGRQCADSFGGPFLQPGTPPGTWDYILDSDRVIGGAVWAAFDEPFYLPDGRKVGYAWHHGFWGLVDAWRRPKPEWWLAKLIFSPVRFPARQAEFHEGMGSLRIPVRNRYSFTDLSEFDFTWELHGRRGQAEVRAAPGEAGEVEVPVPKGTHEGEAAVIRVHDHQGTLVNVAAIQLGERPAQALPRPDGGAPAHRTEGDRLIVETEGCGLVLDRRTGEFVTDDPRHTAPVLAFPSVHVTRFDFGDLAGPNAVPYEVLPNPETRVVRSVSAQPTDGALEVTIDEEYDSFAGRATWAIDRRGVGRVSYEYTYTGEEMSAREIGIRLLLPAECDELSWRRWSEWGVYPDDSISRTEGRARARRDPDLGEGGEGSPPRWPWSLDQTELGTNDFRSVKLNVYEAALRCARGTGVRIEADADVHVRACLDEHGVKLHLLSECRLGPVRLQPGHRLAGEFVLTLVPE